MGVLKSWARVRKEQGRVESKLGQSLLGKSKGSAGLEVGSQVPLEKSPKVGTLVVIQRVPGSTPGSNTR